MKWAETRVDPIVWQSCPPSKRKNKPSTF